MNRSVRGGLLTLVAGAVLVTQTNAWGAVPAGTRDLTFGTHGTAALPKSPHDTTGRSPVTLSLALRSGRIWVSGAQGEQDYAMRLTSTGHADATFRSGRPYFAVSGGGLVSDPLVLPTSDGGAYVLTFNLDEDNKYRLTRLTRSGSLDTHWGSHGRVLVPVGCTDCEGRILAGTVLADGAVRFAGRANVSESDVAQTPLVVGLTASGSPDATVGPGGLARVASAPVAAAGALRAATFDATGRPYFLYAQAFGFGCSTACASQPKLVRSSANGVLDTAWGAAGVSAIPLGGNAVSNTSPQTTAMLASASGELYVGFDERITGSGRIKAVVAHVRPSGSLDPAFGAGGLGHYSAGGGNGSISAMASDGAGHLILGLTYSTSKTFSHLLLRVSASTGAVSTSFGHNGAAASPVYVWGMARQSAHALVVMGWPTSGRTNANAHQAGSVLLRYGI